MAIRIKQVITKLPTPPTTSDRSNFAERADNFVSSLPVLVDEINKWSDELNDYRDDLNNSSTDFIKRQKENIVETIRGTYSDNDGIKAILSSLNEHSDRLREIELLQEQSKLKYKTVTFFSSGTFTPVEGVSTYYVFVRGSRGYDNRSTNGSASSFGSYITAKGGYGNPNGRGSTGSCAFKVLTISSKEAIQVTVGDSGEFNNLWGVVEVTYKDPS